MVTNKYKLGQEKKFLLIGGSGFIGSNIIIKFLEYKLGKILNLDSSISQNLVKTEYVDIIIPGITKIRSFEPDYVIHLASLPEQGTIQNPNFGHKVNIGGLSNTLEELIDYSKLKKFIYLSDYKIYQDTPPFKENSNTFPSNEYLRQKIEAEKIIKKYADEYGIPYLILRVSNIYGEYARDNNSFIEEAITSAIQKKEIIIKDNSIYDYLYISDLIKAIILSFENAFNGTLNIGSGIGYSRENLARYIKELLGQDIKIENIPGTENNQRVYINDIIQAKNILSWDPKTTIQNGIRETIKYFKEVL